MKLALLILIAASTAQAQQNVIRENQAVYAVQCGATATAYTVWNAANSGWLKFNIDRATPYLKQMRQKVGEVARVDGATAKYLADELSAIEGSRTKVAFVDQLDPRLDPPVGVYPRAGGPCAQPEPVIATTQFPDRGAAYQINGALWSRMSEGDRAASLIQLLLAKAYVRTQPRLERAAQAYVANLFSTRWNQQSVADYAKLLFSLELIDVQGSARVQPAGVKFEGLNIRLTNRANETPELFYAGVQNLKLNVQGGIQHVEGTLVTPVNTYHLRNFAATAVIGEDKVQENGDYGKVVVDADGSFEGTLHEPLVVPFASGSSVGFVKYWPLKIEAVDKKICGEADARTIDVLPASYRNSRELVEYCATFDGQIASFDSTKDAFKNGDGAGNVVSLNIAGTQVPLYGPIYVTSAKPLSYGNFKVAFCGPFKNRTFGSSSKRYDGIYDVNPQGGVIHIFDDVTRDKCPRDLKFFE